MDFQNSRGIKRCLEVNSDDGPERKKTIFNVPHISDVTRQLSDLVGGLSSDNSLHQHEIGAEQSPGRLKKTLIIEYNYPDALAHLVAEYTRSYDWQELIRARIGISEQVVTNKAEYIREHCVAIDPHIPAVVCGAYQVYQYGRQECTADEIDEYRAFYNDDAFRQQVLEYCNKSVLKALLSSTPRRMHSSDWFIERGQAPKKYFRHLSGGCIVITPDQAAIVQCDDYNRQLAYQGLRCDGSVEVQYCTRCSDSKNNDLYNGDVVLSKTDAWYGLLDTCNVDPSKNEQPWVSDIRKAHRQPGGTSSADLVRIATDHGRLNNQIAGVIVADLKSIQAILSDERDMKSSTRALSDCNNKPWFAPLSIARIIASAVAGTAARMFHLFE
jgi:hypothetical protein